ncbi:MAG TPA: TIGR04211 family SH3 domain-containing protein [Gammaproteobacteria bacterium]|nr:TIGR04211 family SH3 domain-containing protein [Gammaproteobacteria bacterium]
MELTEKRTSVKNILLFVFLLGSTSAFAETGYITDQLKITLRSGENTTFKVIRMLPSGTAVEILSRNKQTNYANVRLADGTTGYVLNRMILNERPARERLAEAEQKLVVLRQEPGKLSSQLADLQEAHGVLQRKFTEMENENKTLKQKLSKLNQVARDPLRVAGERDDAIVRSQQLSDELDMLRLKNQRLTDKTEQNWFMIGAGVVIAGIFLGLLLPHMRVKKNRSEWGDF